MKTILSAFSKITGLVCIVFFGWMLTSCSDCTPGGELAGQICFSLSAPNCELPVGTQFCMVENDCQQVTGSVGGTGTYDLKPADTECTIETGATWVYLKVPISIHPAGTVPFLTTPYYYSLAQLYHSKYGYYPDPAELASITLAEATEWCDSELARSNKGTLDTMVMDTTSWSPIEIEKPCPVGSICFTKWLLNCYSTLDGTSSGPEAGPAFFGYIKFPDGTTCGVNPVTFEDQGDPCSNSNMIINVDTSCAECGG